MAEPCVRTTAGTVAGRQKDGALFFAGIPYAAPPVGERRFRPPEPAEPWTGTRAAHRVGPVSWQAAGALGGLLSGPEPHCDEDCLLLNVVTPALDDGARPVMVWIHGGAFVGGSGSTPWYKGFALARRGDVVVVTLNYRLGALGFLDVGELGDEYTASGLSGILDQAAALRWVHDNIASFGGDPGNVTIFGESAGAMSVGTLLGMPAADGLYHRAILQSGAASNVLTPDGARIVTRAVLEQLGTGDLSALLEVEPRRLLDAQQAASAALTASPPVESPSPRLATGLPFQPVMDGVHLPRPPLESVREGRAPVPLLAGTNADEFHLFAIGAGPVADDGAAIRRLDRAGVDGARFVEAYRAARPEASPAQVWSAIMTDHLFRLPAVRLLEAQSDHRPDHTFGYWFTWATPAFDGRLGSCHALEIPFVFDTRDQPGAAELLGPASPDVLASAMQDAWLAFARHGDPGAGGFPEPWPPYDRDVRPIMELGDRIGVLHDPGAAERELWESVR